LEAGRFIKDLLYQADVVRIPGLGSFTSTYQNARTDISGRKISPPSKNFQFDDSKKEGDELMWSWISEQEGISESEAKMMVADFVTGINHEIHEGREVTIEDLGTFFRDITGKTEFHFTVENNFNAESIGFTDIDLPDSGNEPFTVQTQTVIHHEEAVKPVVHVEQDIHVRIAEPIYSQVIQPAIHHKKSYKGFWIGLISVLLLIVLSFLAYQQRTRIGELAHGWFSKGKSNVTNTIIKKQVADTGIDRKLAEEAKMKKALDVQSIDSSKVFIPYGKRLMKFYIVAASFTNYDHALKLKDELREKGFDSEIVTVTHKYYKVTMGAYTEKQQAMVELEKLKTITQNNSLWLLHI
jgi:nucleoid DNA-binding protein